MGYTPLPYHQPEMVAQNPCLTQHSELAPIYFNQPQQGELPQQHHSWQEVCYLAPNPNVPQLPQSHIDNLEQVDISSLSLSTPEEVAVESLDLRNDNGSSKGEWRPRLEPSSL